jgi:hypothetical protein
VWAVLQTTFSDKNRMRSISGRRVRGSGSEQWAVPPGIKLATCLRLPGSFNRQPCQNFHAEHRQTLVVSQLTTNDNSGSKRFVRLRAADNRLLGPIAILIVLVHVLCFGA